MGDDAASEALHAARVSEARLAEAQELASIGSWSWEVGADAVSWSDGMYRLYGRQPGDAPVAVGDYLERVHPDDRAMVGAAIARTVTEGEPFEHEYRILTPDGETRWMHARGRVLDERDGAAVRLGGYCMDITDRRQSDDRRNQALADLAGHQAVLERIARNEPLGETLDQVCRDVERRFPGSLVSVLLVDAPRHVLVHAAAPSLPAPYLRAIDGLPIEIGMGACGTAAASRRPVIVADTLIHPYTEQFADLSRRFDLRSVWSHPLTDAAGRVLGTFASYRGTPHSPDAEEVAGVTAAGHLAALAIERDLAEKALSRAAQRDPLTALPNRSRFLEQVDEHLRRPDAHIAVMFLDLDRFKWINDSAGHPSGDRILVEVAARFQRVLGGQGHVVARFGGDEFTVLIDDATPPRVTAAARAARAAVAEPFLLDGGEFFLTVSVGIAQNDGPVDAYGMVRDADAAMYAAKESGRDRHVLFDEQLRERAVARVTLESELRRGIERDEFVLHYQPIADLKRGRWAAVEALVRWNHPTRGLTGPGEFIPLAEETGLIVPLGARVLEMAVAQAADWAAGDRPLTVACNLSVVQLCDPMLPRFIGLLLRHRGLPPDLLELEVTESAVMERLEAARAVLDEIAALGVRLVIDDFGTGYSSIARLRELPVAGVKVDRSFVAKLDTEPDAGPVVAAITDLAHALGLFVVAEGIETPAALGRVRSLGCDLGQGFHLARPAEAGDVERVLSRPPA